MRGVCGRCVGDVCDVPPSPTLYIYVSLPLFTSLSRSLARLFSFFLSLSLSLSLFLPISMYIYRARKCQHTGFARPYLLNEQTGADPRLDQSNVCRDQLRPTQRQDQALRERSLVVQVPATRWGSKQKLVAGIDLLQESSRHSRN